MKVSTSKYRPDIDGLRAIAVLSVLFFHAEFQLFPGGFVGVDVFFVISGFLITRLIVEEIEETGSFRFGSFYMRRFKRLFPALFVMLLATFITAFFIFSPQHFERLSSVLLLSLASLSNIFFWNEAGYFGTDSAFKPLLHTWSLSVEEQFYLFWPLLLSLLFVRARAYYPVLILFGVGVCSFVLNILLVDQDGNFLNKLSFFPSDVTEKGASTAFFLTPFRVFEFVIGAMLVWKSKLPIKNHYFSEIFTLTGIIVILISVVRFSEETSFPSYSALIPCFGVAIIIYSDKARFSGFLLSNKLMVSIGKLSYSLYLVHWPIIVFYKYWKFEELSYFDKYTLCIVSFFFAIILHKFIEKPFRYSLLTASSRVRNVIRTGSITTVIALCIFSIHAWNNGGWAWRLPPEIRDALSQDWNNQSNQTQKQAKELSSKYLGETSLKRVLFIGDSFMGDLTGAMSGPLESTGFVVDAFNFDDQCLPYLKNLGADIPSALTSKCSPVYGKLTLLEKKLYNVDVVVFHSRWQSINVKYLKDFITYCNKYSEKNCPLIVLGSRAEWIHVPTMISKMHSRFDVSSVNSMAFNKRLVWRYHKHQKALAHHTKLLAIPYIDLVSMMCNENNAQCRVLDDQKNILIYDHGHWTVAGQAYYGSLIVNSQAFQQAMKQVIE